MTEAELNAAITLFRIETEDLIPAVLLRYYFNGGTPNYLPYADTAEALAVIGLDWKPYLTVNVDGVEYWFLPDGSLVNKLEYLAIADHSIELYKLVNIATQTFIGRNSAGAGPPEVLTVETVLAMLGLTGFDDKVDKIDAHSLVSDELILKIHEKFAEDEAAVIQSILDFIENLVLTDNNYTDEDKAKLDSLHQDIFTINLPTGDVSERAAGATFGDGITPYSIENPTGWSLAAAANPNDLEITHNLGRTIAAVTVFYVDGTEQVLLMGSLGYTGVSAPSTNVLVIKGLSTKAFPLTVNLIFA